MAAACGEPSDVTASPRQGLTRANESFAAHGAR